MCRLARAYWVVPFERTHNQLKISQTQLGSCSTTQTATPEMASESIVSVTATPTSNISTIYPVGRRSHSYSLDCHRLRSRIPKHKYSASLDFLFSLWFAAISTVKAWKSQDKWPRPTILMGSFDRFQRTNSSVQQAGHLGLRRLMLDR